MVDVLEFKGTILKDDERSGYGLVNGSKLVISKDKIELVKPSGLLLSLSLTSNYTFNDDELISIEPYYFPSIMNDKFSSIFGITTGIRITYKFKKAKNEGKIYFLTSEYKPEDLVKKISASELLDDVNFVFDFDKVKRDDSAYNLLSNFKKIFRKKDK